MEGREERKRSLINNMEGKNNMKISQALPQFFQWLQFQRNDNEVTVKWYKRAINPFVKAMGDLKLSEISQKTIWAWKQKMEEKKLSENTKRHYIRGLKVFLIFCKEMGWTKMDIKKITLPKVGIRKVLYLQNSEVRMWLDSIKDLRFRAINEMFLSTGARLKELVGMNRTDLQGDEIKILGKNNKERIVFVNPQAKKWLDRYLRRRQDNNPAMFVLDSGERITTGIIENWFWHHRKEINFPQKISPHILRHTVGSNMSHNGCDITFIKDYLGHANIQITDQFYRGQNNGKLKEALYKYLNFNSKSLLR